MFPYTDVPVLVGWFKRFVTWKLKNLKDGNDSTDPRRVLDMFLESSESTCFFIGVMKQKVFLSNCFV